MFYIWLGSRWGNLGLFTLYRYLDGIGIIIYNGVGLLFLVC